MPAVLTGKPDFDAPNCPVRALRYYHRYMTEHPDLRKGRRGLFIPFKDNNAGKELSAASISQWICTTIVDAHAYHEVRAMATSLQLFNKVDLQAVSYEGREVVQWRHLHIPPSSRPLPTSCLVLPFFQKRGGGVLEDPPILRIGEIFSLSVGILIMVAPEPVLANARPHLLYSGFI